MTLRIAVQMDPIEHINIKGDSTFALLLEAQDRGHEIFVYTADRLTYRDGDVMADARPVKVQRVEGAHVSVGESVTLDLRRDVDVVLMRQDPPFDIAYITATFLLEMVQPDTLVVNDPESVRNAPEKLFVTKFREFMPPTLITRSRAAVEAFRAEHGKVVVKPLHGNAGAAVFLIDEGDPNLGSLIEMFERSWREPYIVQKFLPAVRQGDKRIILVDGEPAGAINRLPKSGEIRSNLAAGGAAERTALTPREEAICAALAPELKRLGLVFVGIDVIGDVITEVNVTSPTGIVSVDAFNGTNTAGRIWDAIGRRLANRS